jgi:hypothetical protein
MRISAARSYAILAAHAGAQSNRELQKKEPKQLK